MSELPPSRTLEELRAESLARVARNAYPLIGLLPSDVEEAFTRIKSLDRDEWATEWSAIADRYMERAESARSVDAAESRKLYLQAWKIYSFARWPVPNSPGKQKAYEKALDAFRRSLEFRQPALENVRIPFEDKEVIAYLQMPAVERPVPVILAISGLDSRKEDLAERFVPLVAEGVGSLIVDSPGTGEAPLKASHTAEEMCRRALDYLLAREDVDASRIGVYGASFGGHWATKLAITDRHRICAVAAQSPPIHEAFQPDHVRKTVSNTEYLFDYLPAAMSTFDDVTTLDDLVAARGRLSLVAQGYLDSETAPMLVVGGARDTQVPISDLELLLRSGRSPKEAWVNPLGGHMGRQATGWTDITIFKSVVSPWLVRTLQGGR